MAYSPVYCLDRSAFLVAIVPVYYIITTQCNLNGPPTFRCMEQEWNKPFTKPSFPAVQSQSNCRRNNQQGVVTYIAPIEVFSTKIKNLVL